MEFAVGCAKLVWRAERRMSLRVAFKTSAIIALVTGLMSVFPLIAPAAHADAPPDWVIIFHQNP
jgi:hypothetical protein